jgi:hypothetical protein
VVTDLTDPNGNIALIGAGLGAGVSFSTTGGPLAAVDGGRGTIIELDGNRGILERFVFNGGLQSGDRNGAFVSEGGSLSGDGGAVWGRWGPGATITANGITGAPSTGVHFFFGNLTPEALLTGSVPSAATAVRYDYVNGPRPTDEQGNTGQFLSGTFTVNFVQRSIAGSLSYSVDRIAYNLPVAQTPLVAGNGFIGFGVDQRNAGTWFNTVTQHDGLARSIHGGRPLPRQPRAGPRGQFRNRRRPGGSNRGRGRFPLRFGRMPVIAGCPKGPKTL